ncbi:hypothetical protein D3C86_1146850 [compost metagenome]
MTFQCASTLEFGSEQVAIAVRPGLLGSHLGIAYSAHGKRHLLHLAFHKLLLNDPYPPPVGEWAAKVIDLPPIAASQLVALLMAIAPKKNGLPYGINLIAGMGAINEMGEYVPQSNSDGYTCSSFIAELLRKIAFPLIRLDSWMSNNESILWGEAVVCLLKAYGVSAEHVDLVEKNNNGLRLRPEEVAAAAEMPAVKRPATQDMIKARAPVLMEEVRAICHPASHAPPSMQPCIDAYVSGLAAIAATSNTTPIGAAAPLDGGAATDMKV